MHLSVIIATLNKPATACRLAERARELFPDLAIEVIIVTPAGVRCPDAPSFVRHVVDEGRGVYQAYKAGLRVARGEYVWFVGDDDYPLDAAKELAAHVTEGVSDVLAAPVFFSSGRLYRPTRSRVLLLFLNWCQQGVLYRRRVLERHRFYRRMRVAADWYVNVLLRADPALRIDYLANAICLFGLQGLSGRESDRSYRNLRPALAHRTLRPSAFLVFRALHVVEPLARYFVKIR